MIFNGYDFAEYWRVYPDKPLMTSSSVTEKQVPGMIGTRFIRTQLDPLDIPVTMRLKLPEWMTDPGSVNRVKRVAAGKLSTPEPAELVFHSEPDVKYRALCIEASGFDLPAYTGSCQVTFHCCDPLGYRIKPHVVSVANGANNLFISGTHYVMPVFELTTTAIARVRVTAPDGLYMEAVGPFSAGDKLSIDCQAGLVRKNGAIGQFTLESRFFSLPPGPVVVTFSGISGGTITLNERSV